VSPFLASASSRPEVRVINAPLPDSSVTVDPDFQSGTARMRDIVTGAPAWIGPIATNGPIDGSTGEP
jgi:hypothetical protein